jgi:hypothetical protein
MGPRHVNQPRELFFARPAEVRTVPLEQIGNLLEFADEPEATQYLQSQRYWPRATADRPTPRRTRVGPGRADGGSGSAVRWACCAARRHTAGNLTGRRRRGTPRFERPRRLGIAATPNP